MPLIMACCCLLMPSISHAEDKVVLQLKWTHAFQFAGYYAAKELGYYHDAGLNVEIREASPGMDPVQEVVLGRAQYGVGNTSLLLARQDGLPVVVLNVIFQHSPVVLIASGNDGISSVHDLVGKRVMIEENSSELFAYLIKEGISPEQIQVIDHTYKVDDLIQGHVDAQSAYSSYEPYFLNQKGYYFHQFTPREAGIDFYGDNLFTSEREIKDYPERVEAFRQASMRGWAYAMEHKDEIIELILKKYATGLKRRQLQFESQAMNDLLVSKLVEVGQMSSSRWQKIVDTYQSLGQIQKDNILAGFIYKPKQGLLELIGISPWQLFGMIVFILLALSALIIVSLKRVVHLRTKELLDAEIHLRHVQKMESIGALVGGVAHDFNNILAGITGAIFLAKRKFGEDKHFTTINTQAERAANMVKQLLAFARKDTHKMEVISLNDLVKQSASLLALSISERIHLNIDLCQENLPMQGDATQLQQVIMNLVNNARDALQQSSEPVITVAIRPMSLPKKLQGHGLSKSQVKYACLAISDNGSGIDEKYLSEIFEPFFTQKEIGQGTGLGLSMVKGTVESHGGVVAVESELGEGTTFSIYLPLLDSATDTVKHAHIDSQIPHISSSGELLLLVDDETVLREVNKTILESFGYQVLEAANGLEAVETFRAHQGSIKLVILDVVMPRMSGMKAAEKIRQMTASVPIIFATGYDRSQVLGEHDENLGNCTMLSKPFNIEELHKLICSMIKKN